MSEKNRVSGITLEGLKKAFPGLSTDPGHPKAEDEEYTRHWYCLNSTLEETQDMWTEDMNRFLDKESIAIQDINTDGTEEWYMTQIDKVIYDLKNNPFSRRIMTMLWNPADAADMALEPCAYSMTFRVTEKYGKRYLNAILNQRSNDMLAAGAWNVAQYAILVMMLAQVSDMLPGELVHVIADAHIYDRHVPMIEELLKRNPQPAPEVWLDPEIKDFYQFTTDSLHVGDYYVGGEQIKNIPVAI